MPDVAVGRVAAVDMYIASSSEFARPVLAYLREVVHAGAPEVQEAMKWSRPFFVYKGVILGNMSAFNAHCSFGLWGPEIAGVLREEGMAKGDAMGTFGKITAVKDLPARNKLLEYVTLAKKAIDDGTRTKAWSRPSKRHGVAKAEAVLPEELAAALKTNTSAMKRFAAMTAGCKREYCQWIAEAKRDETRARRAATAVEWIAAGKSRNWKYETG